MALQGCSSLLLKSQTPLQMLLEEINFQRTKEMRQLLKDDSGFVVLQGTTYWTDLFVRHFLFQSEPVHSIDSDDLLFFVRKKHVKGSSRHMPKYETDVDVYRKDSRKLPIGDPDVDWEETVYLNMVIHQFDYKLTLAICTRTSPKELQVLRRHSQRVYASPSRRKMDTKGENEEMTYPHICFMVDNFDEVFSDILVRDGEMVCVELVASDKDGAVQGVIFLGSIRYDALKKVYDARQSSLSSKVAQRMTFGLFSSGAGVQTRCEFVRMKGPQGKGHAEMAVTKPKGSGVETPTSEPGFCATDMWDDWEEDPDDYYNYRHQRRLSDPSANLNNFSRYAWRSKDTHSNTGNSKARSENEGLDNLASEVSEIEAGDLRDDLRTCPASSASENLKEINDHNDISLVVKSPPSTCCTNCFGAKKCKHWSDTNSMQMSDIYTKSPTKDNISLNDLNKEEEVVNDSPACLSEFPTSKKNSKNILNVESELVLTSKKNSNKKILTRSMSASSTPVKKSSIAVKKDKLFVNKKKDIVSKESEKDKTKYSKEKKMLDSKEKKMLDSSRNSFRKKSEAIESCTDQKSSKISINCKSKVVLRPTKNNSSNNNCNNNIGNSKNISNNNNYNGIKKKESQAKPKTVPCNKIKTDKLEEYEIAEDVTSLNETELIEECNTKMEILSEKELSEKINVHGKEELPVDQENISKISIIENNKKTNKLVPIETKSHPLEPTIIINSDLNNSSVKPNSTIIPSTTNSQLKAKSLSDENLNSKIKAINISNESKKETNVDENITEETSLLNDFNGNNKIQRLIPGKTASLPRYYKKNHNENLLQKARRLVPKRTTPDGTNIYYWCDLPKRALKELDDGAYNPLWATKGFTQTFHFWKENRRQQSTPLNAFLTYVTLPWWSIAKDLLDHRETPILTF